MGNLSFRSLINAVTRPWAVTKAQRAHVKSNPECAACGSMVKCQGHHVLPYKKFPGSRSDAANFITLCEGVNKCHLRVGHGGDWRFYNPEVMSDATDFKSANAIMRRVLLDRIKAKRVIDA